MGIPDSQLETWSGQGSVTQSASTYSTIRGSLLADDAVHAGHEFKLFLQGSYGNDTNIYAESDVDVVIQLTESFRSDTSALTENEQRIYNAAFSPATYTLTDFKRDVLATLKAKYGDDVDGMGTKAIAIKARGNRRKADVIVASEYRRYRKFNGNYDSSYVEGIYFFDSSWSEIINYPKSHSANLTTKHQATNNRFKPTVRAMKNLRSRLVSKELIEGGLAPSYYIEGLLYNVPNEHFTYGHADRFAKILNWLNGCDRDKLLCANEQYYLLNESSPVTWRRAKCDKFIQAAIDLWNSW